MKRLLRALLVAGVLAGSTFALAPSASAVCWYVDANGNLQVDDDCTGNGYPTIGLPYIGGGGGGGGGGGTAFIAVVGTATLPVFPCALNCSGGHFQSTIAAGATTGGSLVTGLSADFTYNESCTDGQPLQGTAKGTLHIGTSGGNLDEGFSWSRVGFVAVLQGYGGNTLVGAALFVPSPLPACGSSSSVSATVAGGGLLL